MDSGAGSGFFSGSAAAVSPVLFLFSSGGRASSLSALFPLGLFSRFIRSISAFACSIAS
ncbi:MAG: hypothetical protein ACLVLH_22600 [Eisenbergiella massiliensis]